MVRLAIGVFAVTIPLFFYVLTEGLRSMRDAGGNLWMFAGSAAVIVTCLSVAFLFDSRRPPS